MLIAFFLQNKFIVLFIIIFGTMSSLIDRVSEKIATVSLFFV